MLEDCAIFTRPPYHLSVPIRLIKRSEQRLVCVKLPEADTGGKAPRVFVNQRRIASAILVIYRERGKLILIPKAERQARRQSIAGNDGKLVIKLFSELFLCALLFECYAICKKRLNLLREKAVKKAGCKAVVAAERIGHFRAVYAIDEADELRNSAVLLSVIFVAELCNFIQFTLLMLLYNLSAKVHALCIIIAERL